MLKILDIMSLRSIYIFFFWRKCTFSSYILTFFHFGPYILILQLLVLKPINACSFVLFVSQPTKIAEVSAGGIKIL